MPNAIYDFKNYLQEKDGYIKFEFHIQLLLVNSGAKYQLKSNQTTLSVWQVKIDNQEQ